MRMRSLLPFLLWSFLFCTFPWEAKIEGEELQLSLEKALLLRDPSKGLILKKELLRLPLSKTQEKKALKYLEQFSQKVPSDGSKVFWIDRFHRDLFRALSLTTAQKEALEFNPVENHWAFSVGHQSAVFLRPDGLPLPNKTSSPYLDAEIQLLLNARELPRYGSLQIEFYGHRRDMERKSLNAYDVQTMGASLSFQSAVNHLKLDLEQSFFGVSASRPGAFTAGLTWKSKSELSSSVLNGTINRSVGIKHQALRDQAGHNLLGERKDSTRLDFSLNLESLPFNFLGGKNVLTIGSSAFGQKSDAMELDRLGFEPALQLHWAEASGIYEFNSRLSHVIYLSHQDSLGYRDDQHFNWKGRLQRNMSRKWSLHGGWEFVEYTSKQSIYDHRNEVLFIGMDGRW
jgi:hypothetical protein